MGYGYVFGESTVRVKYCSGEVLFGLMRRVVGWGLVVGYRCCCCVGLGWVWVWVWFGLVWFGLVLVLFLAAGIGLGWGGLVLFLVAGIGLGCFVLFRLCYFVLLSFIDSARNVMVVFMLAFGIWLCIDGWIRVSIPPIYLSVCVNVSRVYWDRFARGVVGHLAGKLRREVGKEVCAGGLFFGRGEGRGRGGGGGGG